MEIEAFKDAAGNKCFDELALDTIKLLSLPIFNDHLEGAFSQVALLKDDMRNHMGLPLLSVLIEVRYGLRRSELASATFRPSQQLLRRFDSLMYEQA
jgi:hypothetical protein